MIIHNFVGNLMPFLLTMTGDGFSCPAIDDEFGDGLLVLKSNRLCVSYLVIQIAIFALDWKVSTHNLLVSGMFQA